MHGITQQEFKMITGVLNSDKYNSLDTGRVKAYVIMCRLFGSEKKFLDAVHDHDEAFTDVQEIVKMINQGEKQERIIDIIAAYTFKVSLMNQKGNEK